MRASVRKVLLLFWLVVPSATFGAERIDKALEPIVTSPRWEASDVETVRKMGERAMPALVRLYQNAPEDQRAKIAWIFYGLGWKSAEAKRALMADVHTQHTQLRLQVQWALGRVSNDDDVVDVLVDNMQNDSNPLFRDKAACGLANDQIHLTPRQTARLFRKLIESLSSAEPQVRSIAFLALKIRTGRQDGRGYDPGAKEWQRKAAIRSWQQWLAEYEANL